MRLLFKLSVICLLLMVGVGMLYIGSTWLVQLNVSNAIEFTLIELSMIAVCGSPIYVALHILDKAGW